MPAGRRARSFCPVASRHPRRPCTKLSRRSLPHKLRTARTRSWSAPTSTTSRSATSRGPRRQRQPRPRNHTAQGQPRPRNHTAQGQPRPRNHTVRLQGRQARHAHHVEYLPDEFRRSRRAAGRHLFARHSVGRGHPAARGNVGQDLRSHRVDRDLRCVRPHYVEGRIGLGIMGLLTHGVVDSGRGSLRAPPCPTSTT